MATLNIKDFPDSLHKALKRDASRENRSLSQHVVMILKQALRTKKRRSILELQGLGKEIWAETDAADWVRSERDSWNS